MEIKTQSSNPPNQASTQYSGYDQKKTRTAQQWMITP
jgi:hypothetical protein